ncbi:MAG: acetyl/propionyl/methylcrotonyl-CoA carboxylase subunit alpha [Alphaproteobacteria bacterium]|nr:MAG: acetyl/propionyl/methylcrotonyl-CoA carboxylase subunit alpha [Alphaproteobacteria bacterium]
MFRKILIANRGEIACRIIRTARQMGIATVAVYSEADAEALHVREADEAVLIGPPPSADSYLRIDRIVEACGSTGAEAVHPGYGFLSERAEFATALAKAGIVFIGPPPEAIAAMGDKIESKRLAQAAGVSTVPGHLDVIPGAEHAIPIAREIGYPVMIKASAGGGGKGMRIAHNDAELRDGFSGAQHEAKSSFGDERVFIEKYIEQPRHIEIQVMGDAHGNIVHLGERECSIQRRHQKVIEEAPSPFLDAETRAAMGAQAVALARAVGYRSAGTIEFLVDRQRNFYFLEMNTRLQVEHPVTELVTGLDLVELMIRIAAGEKLPFRQDDVRQQGWAIETRVYAEDPTRNFLPSIGRLVRYRPPEGESVRIDSGVFEGAEISLYYDPMIAKLIVYGADREAAIGQLQDALDGFYISGVRHNVAFLGAIAASERFRAGALSTDFIAEIFPAGFIPPAEPVAADRAILIAAVLAELKLRDNELASTIADHDALVSSDLVVRLNRQACAISVRPEGSAYRIESSDKTCVAATDWRPGLPLLHLRLGDAILTVQIERLAGRAFRLVHRGVVRRAQVLPPRAAELAALMPEKAAADTSRLVQSPMPGLLAAVVVAEGQEVKAGEPLVVVEAMKMENVLRAERDGKVARLRAKPGDSLAVDQVILEFE